LGTRSRIRSKSNTVSRYYLDFDVEIPDNLFEPRKREELGLPD